MIKVGFIGAGGRAQGAHYPNVHRLTGISVEAVAELDEARMKTVVDKYKIPRSFGDHRKMLESVELDAVYCVMNETFVLHPALDCLNAGKHIFIEKPPGANSRESQQLLDAARANNVFCMVGFQRRYTSVTREAIRLVRERGPATLIVGEFHKLLGGPGLTSTLWNDGCHIVDTVRYMAGSDVLEVIAYQDKHNASWKNCYTGLIRFANGATGVILANRSSGGRVLRAELHGYGIGCYLRIPEDIEILEDNKVRRTVTGADIEHCDAKDVDRYEGVLTMHEHFIDCINNKQVPISDLRDVILTIHLLDKLEGIA